MIIGFARVGSATVNTTLTAGTGSYALSGTAATLTKTSGGAVARMGVVMAASPIAVNTSTTSRSANAAGIMVNS